MSRKRTILILICIAVLCVTVFCLWRFGPSFMPVPINDTPPDMLPSAWPINL